ncbi:MAG: hypothetical protein K2X32_07125 [Phycisphaerales bacterium]|nr:hypothetical protein [Phycisphaerales bacterium]
MNFRIATLSRTAIIALSIAGVAAHGADEIRVIYSLNGAQQLSFTADSGEPITVSVGVVPENTTALIHLFDEASGSGVPQFSAGPITIQCVAGNERRVRVLIAPPGTVFPPTGLRRVHRVCFQRL